MPFSPKYVMFSGWVGDQDPTFDGLKNALANMFWSSWYNYTNFGSDIAGYRGGSRTPELLIRWAQVGAFSPLMENGGENSHVPWDYESGEKSTLIQDAYRRAVNVHYELIPYFVTCAAEAYEGGYSVMRPQEERPKDLNPLQNVSFSTYAYQLGQDIFFSPALEDGVR
jgi:alpha-glucosidase (family GH31 glycosyl hydrolase)